MAMSIMGLTSVGNDRDMVRSIIPWRDWKDDKIEGFGRYYYNNGHMYVIVGLIPSEPAATCNLSF